MTDMEMGAPGGAEPSALTMEQLRAIATAARYVHGPADCFERECDDFYDEGGFALDPEPEYCSHMSIRYATGDDADAALWLPLMVKSLEEERDSLRSQLDLLKRRAAKASPSAANTKESPGGCVVTDTDRPLDGLSGRDRLVEFAALRCAAVVDVEWDGLTDEHKECYRNVARAVFMTLPHHIGGQLWEYIETTPPWTVKP